jgi:hypothetical protein
MSYAHRQRARQFELPIAGSVRRAGLANVALAGTGCPVAFYALASGLLMVSHGMVRAHLARRLAVFVLVLVVLGIVDAAERAAATIAVHVAIDVTIVEQTRSTAVA